MNRCKSEKPSLNGALFEFPFKAGGGVHKSSISNHRYPNVFCGMHAPQLVISTTSIGNQTKKA